MGETIRIWWCRAILFVALLIALATGGGRPTFAGVIDKIRADQTIRIAYRDDAPPFSYKEANSSEPTGYMVDLCRAVAKKLADQIGVPSLKITYVSVTAVNRFDAIEKNDADLLCEPTSATLSRRQHVSFSIPTFVDGASLLTSDKNLRDLNGLLGRKIGVLAGTTTEEGLRNTLKSRAIPADVVPVKTHDEGFGLLTGGKISAYFADRSILMFLIKDAKTASKLAIAENYLTLEPYALALPRGDEDFRLAVDTALSHIYRGGEIGAIFEQTFAGKVKPSRLVEALYVISGLPD
jgi:polar amino acid transport system substrate-binding protein/glutamate/aspartate transport system substrate-binding protein